MDWLLIAAVVLVVAWFVRRRARKTDNPAPNPPFEASVTVREIESKPDNPRFATWEEAMNRRVTDRLRFAIEYADTDGIVTERVIVPHMIRLTAHEPEVLIEAWCELRREERSFRSERILKTTNLQTDRPLKDLGQWLRKHY